MKKQVVIPLIIAFAAMVLFCGCTGGKTAVINISSQEWWASDDIYRSDEIITAYTVKAGDKIALGGLEDLTVTVTGVHSDYVTIRTSSPMSDNNSLRTEKNKFKIEKHSVLKLNTLTMDAGDTYKFTMAEPVE